MNKKKKKKIIIITITAVIVIITGIIVGISVNKHNTAIKEALSVSESKEDVCNSFEDEFNAIVDKEYKTAEEYESAKNALIKIRDKINVSDIKEDERLVTMLSEIDKTIAEYDKAIDALTTTTTESTTEATTESTTEKPVNATTKSGSYSNKTSTKSNNSNNTTKATTKAQTTKQTTTSNKITPSYGTVLFSDPNNSKYIMGHWHTINFMWYWNGREWTSSYSLGMGEEKYESELVKYAKKAFPAPTYEGKVGDQVSKYMYIWL